MTTRNNPYYQYKVDMNTFQIPYDRERNYNDPSAPDYTPPYSSYKYKSVYEGNILEIHLVDHCNLNCGGCNHFSPIAEPWFIDVEHFRNQMIAARDNIPNIGLLILIGGEPTLHPNLLEICQIAREIFPSLDTHIGVFTNGLNLAQVKEHEAEYKKISVGFSICSYPGQTNLDEVQYIEDHHLGSYNNTRIFMMQTIVDEEGTGNYVDNFFNCCRHQIPCLTLKDYKLYMCPFAAHVEHYFKKCGKPMPESEGDYIDIRSLGGDLDKLQEFCFTPKPICSYCYHGGSATVWHRSFRDVTEYNTLLSELYFNDYNRYEKIINANKDYFLACLDPEKNPGIVRRSYSTKEVEKYEKRYGKGKIDIIIPYYKLNEFRQRQLLESLQNQTIIKDCVVYLINDGSPNENEIFSLFGSIESLNCVFLKTPCRSGPGVARNKGIENSYNKYILFLDADDYFVDNTALERMYDIIVEQKSLLVNFNMVSDQKIGPTSKKTNYIFERSILDKHNIRYYPFYYGEDYLFMQQLSANTPTNKIYNCTINNKSPRVKEENLFLHYGLENNEDCLTREAYRHENIDILPFSLLSARILFFDYLTKMEKPRDDRFNSIFSDLMSLERDIPKSSDLLKALKYYFLYRMYQYDSNLITEDNVSADILLGFINNDLSVTTSHSILTSEDDIKKFIIDNIHTEHLDEVFLSKEVAKAIIEWIDFT